MNVIWTGPKKRAHTDASAESKGNPSQSEPKAKQAKSSSRSNVTLAQRISVLDWYNKNGKNQTKTAKHFENTFPGIVIKQPLVSSWVKDEDKLRAAYNSGVGLNIKRTNQTEHPQINEALQTWVQQADMAGVTLTGDVIRQKWRQFADLFKVPESEWLMLSEGWLTSFKTRNGLKNRRKHGEAASASKDAAIAERKRIREITDLYHPRDIYNMDETGLFYG